MSIDRKLGLAVATVLTAGLVTACGSGGNNPPRQPAQQAPQIVGLTDQTLPQDNATPVLSFQISDSDSGAGSVTVTAESSDPNLIRPTGIVLGGSGANRTLQIVPAAEAIGTAMITVRATDPDGLMAQQVIRVTVNGVFLSFRDTVIDVFPRDANGAQQTLRGFTFTPDADGDPAAFSQFLQ